MVKKTFIERENEKLGKFRSLPHFFKILGVVLSIISAVALVIVAFQEKRPDWLLIVTWNCLNISLLLIAISKDKVEDEFKHQVRLVAFGIAFTTGVLYTVFQPAVDFLLKYMDYTPGITFEPIPSFLTLTIMLAAQILLFHGFKHLDE